MQCLPSQIQIVTPAPEPCWRLQGTAESSHAPRPMVVGPPARISEGESDAKRERGRSLSRECELQDGVGGQPRMPIIASVNDLGGQRCTDQDVVQTTGRAVTGDERGTQTGERVTPSRESKERGGTSVLQHTVEVAQHEGRGAACLLVTLETDAEELQKLGRGRASPIHRTIEMEDHDRATARRKEESDLQARDQVVCQPLRQRKGGEPALVKRSRKGQKIPSPREGPGSS